MFIGVNDIISAGQLAAKLYDWGSSRYTSAHIEYQDFMKDIQNVSAAISAVQREVNACRVRYATLAPDLSTLEVAVGGVYETLLRCQKLLRENPKFKWADGFITNIEWNFDVAERVKALQTRVFFHCTKINLVIEPLKLLIYRSISDQLAMVLEEGDNQFSVLNSQLEAILKHFEISSPINTISATVPVEVAERFAVAANPLPSTGPGIIQFYVDAIVYWYDGSTRSFVEQQPTMMRPPTIQYINSLKCLWLLQTMRRSQYFDKFCQDIVPKIYIRQLQRRVDEQFQRFRGDRCLQAPDVDELVAVPLQSFEIWPDFGIIDIMPAITEAQSFEHQILKVPLQRLVRSRDQELTLFRPGPDTLRLAITITNPNVAVTDRYNHKLDCRKAVLVPIYAHPKNKSSCSMSWKSSADDPSVEELPFTSNKDLLEFQQAITNFMVRFHATTLTSVRGKAPAFRLDGRHGTELGSEGRLQLWSYRQPELNHRGRQLSMTSADTSGSSSTRGWTQEFLERVNAGSQIRSIDTGAFLDKPVPAKIVIYTLQEEALRLLSITLDENTIIDDRLCDCSNKKKAEDCKRICLKQNSKDNIKVRIYDAGSEDISRFNIAQLRHPSHADAEQNGEEQSFKFLTLDFSSVKERQQLCESFTNLSAIVRHNVAIYNKALNNMRSNHVHRPG